jgi:hypothetical protein
MTMNTIRTLHFFSDIAKSDKPGSFIRIKLYRDDDWQIGWDIPVCPEDQGGGQSCVDFDIKPVEDDDLGIAMFDMEWEPALYSSSISFVIIDGLEDSQGSVDIENSTISLLLMNGLSYDYPLDMYSGISNGKYRIVFSKYSEDIDPALVISARLTLSIVPDVIQKDEVTKHITVSYDDNMFLSSTGSVCEGSALTARGTPGYTPGTVPEDVLGKNELVLSACYNEPVIAKLSFSGSSIPGDYLHTFYIDYRELSKFKLDESSIYVEDATGSMLTPITDQAGSKIGAKFTFSTKSEPRQIVLHFIMRTIHPPEEVVDDIENMNIDIGEKYNYSRVRTIVNGDCLGKPATTIKEYCRAGCGDNIFIQAPCDEHGFVTGHDILNPLCNAIITPIDAEYSWWILVP